MIFMKHSLSRNLAQMNLSYLEMRNYSENPVRMSDEICSLQIGIPFCSVVSWQMTLHPRCHRNKVNQRDEYKPRQILKIILQFLRNNLRNFLIRLLVQIYGFILLFSSGLKLQSKLLQNHTAPISEMGCIVQDVSQNQ